MSFGKVLLRAFAKREKSLDGLKSGNSIGRFLSDGGASTEVKGLMPPPPTSLTHLPPPHPTLLHELVKGRVSKYTVWKVDLL